MPKPDNKLQSLQVQGFFAKLQTFKVHGFLLSYLCLNTCETLQVGFLKGEIKSCQKTLKLFLVTFQEIFYFPGILSNLCVNPKMKFASLINLTFFFSNTLLKFAHLLSSFADYIILQTKII